MLTTILFVALPGPPFVIAQIIANSLSPQMNCNVVVITIMPRSDGTVTCQKRDHAPAPSTVDASSSSLGTVCNPASSINVKKGNLFQMAAKMVAMIASFPSPPNQASGWGKGCQPKM